MGENKNLSGAMEPLSEPELKGVSGGYTTTEEVLYFCPKCGGRAERTLFYSFFRCTKCGKDLLEAQTVKKVFTKTIDGDAHTIRAEF